MPSPPRRRTMDSIPGGLSSVLQLHTLSVDVAAGLVDPADTQPASWHRLTFPSYAAVRRSSSPSPPSTNPPFSKSSRLSSPLPQLPPVPPFMSPSPSTRRPSAPALLPSPHRRFIPHRPLSSNPLLPLPMALPIIPSSSTAAPIVIPPTPCSPQSTSSSSPSSPTPTSPSSTSPTRSSPPRASCPHLSGPLRKRARLTGIPVVRHFELRDGALYSFRAAGVTTPSWKLPLHGARVLVPSPLRIVVETMDARRVVLGAPGRDAAKAWAAALTRAAAVSTACEDDEEEEEDEEDDLHGQKRKEFETWDDDEESLLGLGVGHAALSSSSPAASGRWRGRGRCGSFGPRRERGEPVRVGRNMTRAWAWAASAR